MTTGNDGFERELARRLDELAPRPTSDALARTTGRIRATPQRRRARIVLASAFDARALFRGSATVAAVVAALLIGILIGQAGLPLQGEASPTAQRSPLESADATASPPIGGAWQEPDAYTFELQSSCGLRSLLGRFRVVVLDGAVATYAGLDEQAQRWPGPKDDLPTLGDLERLAAEAEAEGADRVTAVRDPADGRLLELEIDWAATLIDDEECYAILNYRVGSDVAPLATWSRVDLPDPAPDVFGGGTPNGLVMFGGGYVAVGTVSVACCAEGDLSQNRGVVWTSDDGRTWQVHDRVAALEHAMIDDLVTDGSVLIAVGRYADPAVGEPSYSRAAIWVSTDALAWSRQDGEFAPSVVAATNDGFVGAYIGLTRSQGTPFSVVMRSADGLTWTPVSESWVGGVADFAVTSEGRVIGVGTDVAFIGSTDTALAWISEDGDSWPRPIAIEPGARMASVAEVDGLLVAVGAVAGQYSLRANTPEDVTGSELVYRPAVWSSTDGVTWVRRHVDAGVAFHAVHAVGGAFVIVGEAYRGTLANGAAWVSTDGVAWQRVPDEGVFDGSENVVASILETADGFLAVGRRWDDETNHPVPVTWTATW